jgi:ABC-type transporter Mla subunit MlaD
MLMARLDRIDRINKRIERKVDMIGEQVAALGDAITALEGVVAQVVTDLGTVAVEIQEAVDDEAKAAELTGKVNALATQLSNALPPATPPA